MHREPSQTRILAVRLRFEPNRLAPEYLADAYERLVPCFRRRLSVEVLPDHMARTQAEFRRKEVA